MARFPALRSFLVHHLVGERKGEGDKRRVREEDGKKEKEKEM